MIWEPNFASLTIPPKYLAPTFLAHPPCPVLSFTDGKWHQNFALNASKYPCITQCNILHPYDSHYYSNISKFLTKERTTGLCFMIIFAQYWTLTFSSSWPRHVFSSVSNMANLVPALNSFLSRKMCNPVAKTLYNENLK